MRSRILVLLLVVINLCGLGAWSAYSQRRQSARWEYKSIHETCNMAGSAGRVINEHAAEGWELITVVGGSELNNCVFYLKRAR